MKGPRSKEEVDPRPSLNKSWYQGGQTTHGKYMFRKLFVSELGGLLG